MPEIVRQIDVDAPVAAVWRVLADFGAVADWAPDVLDARCTTDARSGVGCARVVTASNGTTIEEVVTAWNEGRSLTFAVPGGLARVVGSLAETWSVEDKDADAASRVIVRMQYRSSSGPAGAAVTRALVRPTLAKMLTANLAGLKRHVETVEHGSQPTRPQE